MSRNASLLTTIFYRGKRSEVEIVCWLQNIEGVDERQHRNQANSTTPLPLVLGAATLGEQPQERVYLFQGVLSLLEG